MAAVAIVNLALAEPGTNVVTSRFLFGNTSSLFEQTLKPRGLAVSCVDKYSPLVEVAQREDLAQLHSMSADVFGMARTMEDLCARMDNSMHFPGETAEPLTIGPS